MAARVHIEDGFTQAQEVLILGAGGPAGSHLAAALNRRSIRDRAVMQGPRRRDQSLLIAAEDPGEIDAADPDALARSLEGYRLVYDCLTASAQDPARYRSAARNLAIALVRTGVKLIHVCSYWSYCPIEQPELDESHPREGGEEWVRFRREAEDILRAAGAAIVHLPDLYGPLLHGSLVQRAIEQAHATRSVRWIGPPDVEREYAFAPDAMEAVVRLSYCPEAIGQHWIVGGNGALSAQTLAEIAGKKLNTRVSVRSASPLAFRLRALFDEKVRALRQGPDTSTPIRFDSAKLCSLIGPIPASSHEQGIARTIEWLERRRSIK